MRGVQVSPIMSDLPGNETSSGDMSDVLSEVFHDELTNPDVVDVALESLNLVHDPVGGRLRNAIDEMIHPRVGSESTDRSVNTYHYPGNLYEYTLSYPSEHKGVPREALWCELTAEVENSRYNTHFRMPKQAFEDLLYKLKRQGPLADSDTAFLKRKDSTEACVKGHRSYCFRRILALTLYFLARSSTGSELSTTFGIPPSTVWVLVGEGVVALVRVLLHGVGGNSPVVRFPQTEQEKLAVIGGFQELIGHLPWCLGAIDGTHIGQRKPDVSRCPVGRDLYWSWKSKVSQLLVWIVDARGRAIYVSAGHPGSSADAGVWGRDPLRMRCDEGLLSEPKKKLCFEVNGAEHSMQIGPYFVGDGAFQLKSYMMRCYPTDATHSQRVFNQAVCDVRKVVEQAIGRLKMCWQFCHKNVFHGDTEFVRNCIEACVGLHNFRMEYNINSDEKIVREWMQKELGHDDTGPVQVNMLTGPLLSRILFMVKVRMCRIFWQLI